MNTYRIFLFTILILSMVPSGLFWGIMLIIALEAVLKWGLTHQNEFIALCKAGNDYPIYRITEFKGFC